MNDIKDSFICADKREQESIRKFDGGILNGALEFCD